MAESPSSAGPSDALRSRALRPMRREMQIVFQDPYGSLSPRMSVGQIVEEGLEVHDLGGRPEEREALIVETLGEVGLDPASRHRYPHEFSRWATAANRHCPRDGPEAAVRRAR